MSSANTPARKRFHSLRPATERASALKERIYATFTGLAIVVVIGSDIVDTPALTAFLTLAIGLVGIGAAGFVAEVIAHQVTHAAAPTGAELRTMGRISSGALASAAIPLLALAAACFDWMTLESAILTSTVLYVATLALVAIVAVARTSLPRAQKFWALLVMLGFIALVVIVLFLSKLH